MLLTNVLPIPKQVASLMSLAKLFQARMHIEGKGCTVRIHDYRFSYLHFALKDDLFEAPMTPVSELMLTGHCEGTPMHPLEGMSREKTNAYHTDGSLPWEDVLCHGQVSNMLQHHYPPQKESS